MRSASANDEVLLDLGRRPRGQRASQVVQRLFPHAMIAKSGNPAARGDWVPSQAQRLAIDDFLHGLPANMRSLKVSNAPVEARNWIVLAVQTAGLDLERRRIAEREIAARLERSAAASWQLEKEIADFLDAKQVADLPNAVREWRLAPGFGYRASRMDYTRHNEIAKVTHAALHTIANARDAARKLAEFARAERDHLIPPHAPGDIWRQGFVSQLCYGWRNLTECDPTPDGGRFRRFVLSCYDSLEGNNSTAARVDAGGLPKFDEWIGVIRTVVRDLKGRPDWDGFDRYERHHDPLGTSREAVTETFAERRVRDATRRHAELAALTRGPGARELIEGLIAGHLERKPRPK